MNQKVEEVGNNPTDSWKVYKYFVDVVVLLNKETNLIVLSASPYIISSAGWAFALGSFDLGWAIAF